MATKHTTMHTNDHHTRRAECLYNPDDETADANFSSVLSWSSISRRILCSSSDNGTP